MGIVGGPEDMHALRIDARYDCTVGIDIGHHYLHHGAAYKVGVSVNELDEASTLVIALRTPNSARRSHMTLGFYTPLGGVFRIWEGATWTAGTGTAVTVVNCNRGCGALPSGLTGDSGGLGWVPGELVQDPEGLSVESAVLIHSAPAWGSKKAGATADGDCGFLLANCTTYAAVFTSAGDGNGAAVCLSWCEHLDYGLVSL